MLPTISEEMTEEYLMNTDAVTEVFAPEIQLLKTVHYKFITGTS